EPEIGIGGGSIIGRRRGLRLTCSGEGDGEENREAEDFHGVAAGGMGNLGGRPPEFQQKPGEWAIGNGESTPPATPPLGIGNREWGIVGIGNRPPHSRLPIPKGGAVGRGSFPIPTIPHSRLPIPKGSAGW